MFIIIPTTNILNVLKRKKYSFQVHINYKIIIIDNLKFKNVT